MSKSREQSIRILEQDDTEEETGLLASFVPADWKWYHFALIGAVIYMFMKGSPSMFPMFGDQAIVIDSDKFYNSLDAWGKPYASIITQAANQYKISPYLLAAIGYQESGWGKYLTGQSPGGTGDNGHGRGLMQIDDRAHANWIASHDWTDPATNIFYGASVLASYYWTLYNAGLRGAALDQAAVSAYNTGPGNVLKSVQAGRSSDSTTTGGNYSVSVINKGNTLRGAVA